MKQLAIVKLTLSCLLLLIIHSNTIGMEEEGSTPLTTFNSYVGTQSRYYGTTSSSFSDSANSTASIISYKNPILAAINELEVDKVEKLLKEEAITLEEKFMNEEKEKNMNAFEILFTKIPYHEDHLLILKKLLRHPEGKKLINTRIENKVTKEKITTLSLLLDRLSFVETDVEVATVGALMDTLIEHGENPFLGDKEHPNVVTISQAKHYDTLIEYFQNKRKEYEKTHPNEKSKKPCCNVI